MKWEIIGNRLLDLLFPPKCPFCGRVVEHSGTVCETCTAHLPCTDEAGVLRMLPGEVPCAAPFWYEGCVRDGLLRLKFQRAASAAESIGAWMAQCAAEQFSGAFDCVTWVPVSRKRLRQRGYDQARLLAEAMCRIWQVSAESLLEKTVENGVQSRQKTADDRWKNVQHVYRAKPSAQNRRILLVDDICTTGATLTACAQVLREAGAASVVCVTAAVGRPPVR